MKRKYIRHPSDIPIIYSVEQETTNKNSVTENKELSNISQGGLSFTSSLYIKPNTQINIQIPLLTQVSKIPGVVVWCKKNNTAYSVGVKFLDTESQFKIRMVEQICYIEHFKKQVLRDQGRLLSGEQAAEEWIAKYAGSFPKQ